MKPEDIHLTDWARMFLGEVPPVFLLEIILRTVVLFLMLLLCIRLLGKRMAAQLSRHELACLVSLSAGVGISIQDPQRGLLPSIIACLVVVGIQKFIAKLTSRNESFEKLVQDDTDILVNDGKLILDCLRDTQITKDRLYAQLRSEGFLHLGTVKRLYLEPDGNFTCIKEEEPRAGLCIIPEWDEDFRSRLHFDDSLISCNHCGLTHSKTSSHLDCPNCHHLEWVQAVI